MHLCPALMISFENQPQQKLGRTQYINIYTSPLIALVTALQEAGIIQLVAWVIM